VTLRKRFEFSRLVFVGDRGMVPLTRTLSQSRKISMGSSWGSSGRRKRQASTSARRRRRHTVDRLSPAGITTRETEDRPTAHTAARKYPSGNPEIRVIVIDSDERRG